MAAVVATVLRKSEGARKKGGRRRRKKKEREEEDEEEDAPNLAFMPPSVRQSYSQAREVAAVHKMNDGQFSQLTLSELEELCEVLGDDETKLIGLDRVRILLMTSIEPNCTEEEVQVLLERFLTEGRHSYGGVSVSAEELHGALTRGPGFQAFLQLRKLPHASSNYDRRLFVDSVVQITDRHDAFISLPITLIYIAVFVCIVSNHLQIYERGKMEKALEAYINGRDPKAEFDNNVDNIQSFWGWMLDEEGTGSGLKGPLGLKKPSPINGSWPQYWMASRSIFVGDLAMTLRYFNGTELRAFLIYSVSGQMHLMQNPQDYLGAALAGAAQLRDTGWSDPDIREIELNLGTFSPRCRFFAVVMVRARFTRSGTVVHRVDADALPLEPYSTAKPMSVVWDALFVLVLLYITLGELSQMCSSLMLGCGELWDYFGFWNVIDLVCIVLGFMTISIWVAVCLQMAELSAALPRDERQYILFDVMSFKPDELLGLYDTAQRLNDLYFALHIIMALNTVSIVAKFFKAFTSNPRLKVVTDTFHQASNDFAHFGIIFATIFLPFVIIGHVLFGNDIVEFSTIFGSINAGLVLLFGEFEWYVDIFDEYGGQGTMPSGMPIVVLFVWYVMYMFLVLIVLLNMLLAIIIEHYTKVTGRLQDGEDSPTLWKQVRRYLKFQRETRRFLSLESIRSLLENDKDPAHPADEVTEKSLVDAFPGMTEEQAMWIIRLLWKQASAAGEAEEEEVFDAELRALAESASAKLGFVEDLGAALGAAPPPGPGEERGLKQGKLAAPSMWDTVQELVGAVDRMRQDQARLSAAVQELGGPDPPAEPRERGEREARGSTVADTGAESPPARRREPPGTVDAGAEGPPPKRKERKDKDKGKDERDPADRERKKDRQKKPPVEPTVEKE